MAVQQSKRSNHETAKDSLKHTAFRSVTVLLVIKCDKSLNYWNVKKIFSHSIYSPFQATSPANSPIFRIPQNNGKPQLPPTNYADMAAMPRNVDAMSQFGSNINKDPFQNTDHFPQLANRQLLNDAAPAVMNLARDEAFKRQADGTEVDTSSNEAEGSPGASGDDEIRCIPKVMQVGFFYYYGFI